MKDLRFRYLLALVLFPAVLFAAKDQPAWQTAKLVSVEGQHGSTTTGSTTNGNTTTQNNVGYIDYSIVLDDGKMLYFGTERLVFRWEHEPHFIENEPVKFALNGDKLVVLDDQGKQIKLKLVKRRLKE